MLTADSQLANQLLSRSSHRRSRSRFTILSRHDFVCTIFSVSSFPTELPEQASTALATVRYSECG
jgi:hypothetical protein